MRIFRETSNNKQIHQKLKSENSEFSGKLQKINKFTTNIHTNPFIVIFQGLAKYTDLFVRHEVDLQTFASLTDLDLREVGVQTFGARKKLLHLINSKTSDYF